MRANNRDIRSASTEQAIMDAMLTLLGQMSFRSITVNDICKASSVSRTTFYLHFEDKYHLIISCIASHLYLALEHFDGQNVESFYGEILSRIYEHKIALIRLVNYDHNKELKKKFNIVLTDIITIFYQKRLAEGITLELPFEIIALYVSHGIAAIFLWWIETDLEMPIPDLSRYLARIHMYDFYSLSPAYPKD